MRTHPDLSPEAVIEMAKTDTAFNLKLHKQRQDKVMDEHLKLVQKQEKQKVMSFQEYTQTIGPKPNEKKFEALLTTNRTVEQCEKRYEDQMNNGGFHRGYGEFSHEVERNIHAGIMKRK